MEINAMNLAFLKNVAEKVRWCDDPEFHPCDYAAGNIDDAYNGGFDDGRGSLARELLRKLEQA